MNYLIITVRFIWAQKWKILSLVSFALIFLFLLFPFKDLNDYLSSQVSLFTQNKVYMQFEDMNLNPLTTTVTFNNISFETSEIESLGLDKLSATPSIFALIKKQPGGQITADGLFGGHVEIKVVPGEKLSSGAAKTNIDLMAEKVSLKKLRETLKISLPLNGSAALNSKLTVDLSFKEQQPDGEITAIVDNFEMPITSVELPDLGSITLPEIKFKQVDIRGKLAGGKLTIDSAKLGSASDDLSGLLKGEVLINLQMNASGKLVPVMGGYTLVFDLATKPAFKEKAKFFLDLIDNYKREENGLSHYKFKLHAANNFETPRMTAP